MKPKIYGIGSKLINSSTPWSVTICQISDPSQSGSLDILFTRLFLYKMPVSEKGSNSTKIYGIDSKVNQLINTLVSNYMPNIRILAKGVLKIFCSQGCSYTKCLCPKKGNSSTKNLRNMFKS